MVMASAAQPSDLIGRDREVSSRRFGWSVTSLSSWLCLAAKRRPIHAHDPAIRLRIEPIHDRVDEHPFVPVVVDQDHSDTFAKLKLLSPHASRAAGEAANIPFGRRTDIEIEPDVRSAVRVGRRIIIRIVHGREDSPKPVSSTSQGFLMAGALVTFEPCAHTRSN